MGCHLKLARESREELDGNHRLHAQYPGVTALFLLLDLTIPSSPCYRT